MWGLEEVFGEGDPLAAQLSWGLLCLLCACGVPGLGGAVPEKGIFVATVFVGVLEIWVCRGLIGMFVGGHKWLMTRLSGWRGVKEYES